MFHAWNDVGVDLNQMLVFVEVVRAGSFTGAGRALGMPKSSVSRTISSLEQRLGAQLLQRTTRKLRLTDVGEDYHRACRVVVAEARAAEERVAEMHERPCGRLRVTAPPTFAFLGSILAEYLRRYPEVRVELVSAERLVDLVGEGFDVAVRAGRLADSSLISRRLGIVTRILVAAPRYVEEAGTPSAPADLREHATIRFGGGREGDTWTLRSGRKAVEVRPEPRLVVDDYDLLLRAACSGAGIALLPTYVCRRAVDEGRLVHLLTDWAAPEIPVHAVYPQRRGGAMKLTAFLDLLREHFREGLAAD